VCILAALGLLAGAGVLFTKLGQEFTPTLDEKNIVMEARRIPSTALSQSQAISRPLKPKGAGLIPTPPDGSEPYCPPPAPPPALLWVWAAFPRSCCSALLPAAAASLLGVSRVVTGPLELPAGTLPLVPADWAKAADVLNRAAVVRRINFLMDISFGDFSAYGR